MRVVQVKPVVEQRPAMDTLCEIIDVGGTIVPTFHQFFNTMHNMAVKAVSAKWASLPLCLAIMNQKTLFQGIGVLAAYSSLMGCSATPTFHPTNIEFVAHRVNQNNRASDTPATNPKPQHWLVIRGHKDPSMAIWFGLGYSTTHSNCESRNMWGVLGGAPQVSQGMTDWVEAPAGLAEFSVRFSLDRYMPGPCGWKATGGLVATFLPSLTPGPNGWHGFISISPEASEAVNMVEQCHLYRDNYWQGTFVSCYPEHGRNFTISNQGGVVSVDFVLNPEIPRNVR